MTDYPTMREFCQPVSGYGAGDLRYTGLTSVKNCRVSTRQSGRTHNPTTNVGVTSGFVTDSTALEQLPNHRPGKASKNARKRYRRALGK